MKEVIKFLMENPVQYLATIGEGGNPRVRPFKFMLEKEGKIFFNLAIVARLQLEALYPGILIEESGFCTFQDERFHSYRRNKTLERNWKLSRLSSSKRTSCAWSTNKDQQSNCSWKC